MHCRCEAPGIKWARGSKCQDCLTVTRWSWPLLEWEEVVAEVEASKEFSNKFKRALACYQQPGNQWFGKESFNTTMVTGWSVEREWTFYTEKEFEEVYGCSAEDLGLSVDALFDEQGRQQKGVLVRSHDGPGLKVRSHHIQQHDLKLLHQVWQQQLRTNQSQEFSQKYLADAQSVGPRAFLKPTTVPTHASMAALVQKCREEKERSEAQRLAAQTLVPEVGPEEPEEAEAEEEDDDDDDDDAMGSILPSRRLRNEKGKGRGKNSKGRNSKGKGRTGGRGKGAKAEP
eukprot:6460494-Amphidinium_carterae.1